MTDDQIDALASRRLLRAHNAAPPLISTRADAVVDSLAASIETGELSPGDPLSVTDLARRLSVAPATVRSALSALGAIHLIEHRFNRASVVATPTPAWFISVAAECSGLSIAGADLGIAAASDAQIDDFTARADAVRELWSSTAQSQIVGAEGLWQLLDMLVGFSRNPYLIALHASKRTALVFGIRSLSRSRNPAMLRSVVDALVSAVQDRDRVEATDIIRDLYTFVIDGVTEL